MSGQEAAAPTPGDLVEVLWNDASIGVGVGGKSSVQVPVRSWGIYVGTIGEPPHLILSQNDFAYNREVRAEDYTAIPQPWAVKVIVIQRQRVTQKEAAIMLKNIIIGESTRRRRRISRRIFQLRVDNGIFWPFWKRFNCDCD